MDKLLWVGVGGFVGSALRYLITESLARGLAPGLPYATLVVNLAGCFVIGLVGGLGDVRPLLGPGARLFLVIGLLGGFTTYSTFAYDSLALLRSGETLRFVTYNGLHFVGGLAAVGGGFQLGRII